MRTISCTMLLIVSLLVSYGETYGQLAGFRTAFKYVGNKRSHLLHLIYYKHLPPDSLRSNFETQETAIASGYRKCPICFPPTPLISGYDFERRIGMETAGVVNYYYPAPASEQYTARLQEEGRGIVSNWPFPLKGYRYSFLAIESEEIKAFSCASGLIYLTTGLMDIVESNEELDMILAHEISHVEQRHGLEEYREESKAFFDDDPISVADRLNRFAKGLVLVGYTDQHERDADFYALAYGAGRYKNGNAALSLVLQKLKDVQWRDIRVGGGLFSGKSNLDERMAAIRNTRIRAFRPGTEFYRRGNGNTVNAKMSLIFQKLKDKTLTLYTSVESRETIRFGNQGESRIVIRTVDASYTLAQESISFIRKPPEGMEGEIDHNTYVIIYSASGENDVLPLTTNNIVKISLVKPLGPLDHQSIIEFLP